MDRQNRPAHQDRAPSPGQDPLARTGRPHQQRPRQQALPSVGLTSPACLLPGQPTRGRFSPGRSFRASDPARAHHSPTLTSHASASWRRVDWEWTVHRARPRRTPPRATPSGRRLVSSRSLDRRWPRGASRRPNRRRRTPSERLVHSPGPRARSSPFKHAARSGGRCGHLRWSWGPGSTRSGAGRRTTDGRCFTGNRMRRSAAPKAGATRPTWSAPDDPTADEGPAHATGRGTSHRSYPTCLPTQSPSRPPASGIPTRRVFPEGRSGAGRLCHSRRRGESGNGSYGRDKQWLRVRLPRKATGPCLPPVLTASHPPPVTGRRGATNQVVHTHPETECPPRC